MYTTIIHVTNIIYLKCIFILKTFEVKFS